MAGKFGKASIAGSKDATPSRRAAFNTLRGDRDVSILHLVEMQSMLRYRTSAEHARKETELDIPYF